MARGLSLLYMKWFAMYVFRYVVTLRPPTSYGVHTLLFRTTPLPISVFRFNSIFLGLPAVSLPGIPPFPFSALRNDEVITSTVMFRSSLHNFGLCILLSVTQGGPMSIFRYYFSVFEQSSFLPSFPPFPVSGISCHKCSLFSSSSLLIVSSVSSCAGLTTSLFCILSSWSKLK